MTISELLVRDISWEVDFIIAGVQKGETETVIASMEGVRVLCQLSGKLITQKYLEAGDWGNSVSILNRIAKDIRTVICVKRIEHYNRRVNDIAQEALDEVEELEKLLSLRMRSEDCPIVDCYV